MAHELEHEHEHEHHDAMQLMPASSLMRSAMTAGNLVRQGSSCTLVADMDARP
jgi:hypothetical protein